MAGSGFRSPEGIYSVRSDTFMLTVASSAARSLLLRSQLVGRARSCATWKEEEGLSKYDDVAFEQSHREQGWSRVID
jgi:hypothetical protein